MSWRLARSRRAFLGVGTLILTSSLLGCVPPRLVPPNSEPKVDNGIFAGLQRAVGFPLTQEAMLAERDITVEDVRTFMANRTGVSIDPSHGTQVEYATTDGRVYLWYPGNDVILAGRWETRPDVFSFYDKDKNLRRFANAKICFSYGENTHNPATGHTGAAWQCTWFRSWRKNIRESKRGDILKLQGRSRAPFPLTKDPVSLESLQSRIRS